MADATGFEDLTITLRSQQGNVGSGGDASTYVLVFDRSTCRQLTLPVGGEVVIGRAPEAHVRIEDVSVSRHHAKLLIAGTDVRLIDLGSHNGTRVNGEAVTGSRPLLTGDVITVCAGAAIVFHRVAVPTGARALLDGAAFRARLEEELERSVRYQSTFSVVTLQFAADRRPGRHDVVVRSLSTRLRLMDAPSKSGEDRIELLLPELAAAEAESIAHSLAGALQADGHGARVGIAHCPEDGADVDTLLAGARAAARLSGVGGATSARDAFVVREIGAGITVTVADPAMLRLFELIEKLAASEVPALISGETGSGKEIAATALHYWSKRSSGPLVAINCATIPEGLIESELFGHEKGAFSGATATKLGLLESAAGGTVFLDEVGELPLATQAKLLRVLESKRVLRLGDLKERPLDIRIVCATHKDLDLEVKAGRFRQDLLYRLNAARLVVPPLRHRRRELPLLARRFLAAAHAGPEVRSLSIFAMQALLEHPWPGNIRELKNAMEYVAATADTERVERWHLPSHIARIDPELETSASRPVPSQFRPLAEEVRELERRRMSEALTVTGGVQKHAAELIGMPLRTFVGKLKEYQLSPAQIGRSGRRRD